MGGLQAGNKQLFPRVSQRQKASRMHMSANKPWAVIFDCDGVILESESLHREAYNKMFKEFKIKYNWSPDYYDQLQNKVGGGIPKMRYYFGEHGWPESKLGAPPTDPDEQQRMLETLQDFKTDVYKDMVSDGTAKVRPGVLRLIEEVSSMQPNKPKLAICSASTKGSCLFVLDNLLGKEILSRFDLILAGDDVSARKPDPEIYILAAQRLGIQPERAVVIEDSLIGLQAALAADMPCIITYTHSTRSQDFRGAKAVYSELGEGADIQVNADKLRNIALSGAPAVA